MGRPHLRVYYGPDGTGGLADEALQQRTEPPMVTVQAGEIFPLLADAVRSQRTWLHDFADDEIKISADLYEVILAYQHCRRPSA
jgi:hypothetical protein